jgi:glutamate racemase
MSSSHPIGIFDSGVGGLTVLRALRAALPYERMVYFADTANVPYGDKTPEQIKGFSRQILQWMQNDLGVKMVIAACHTSSALALSEVAKEFKIPLIGTIDPTVTAILQDKKHTRVGIIATPASANNRTHEKALINSGYQGLIHTIACQEFVPLIEAGKLDGAQLHEITQQYLEPFHQLNLTTLIYGCTHYPWIAEVIARYLPPLVICIDPAQHIVAQATQTLTNKAILNKALTSPAIDFYCSAHPDQFAEVTGRFLLMPTPVVKLKTF